MTKTTYYAQFDGEEIAGTRYALGDKIDADVHPAVLQVLADQGRISSNVPAGSSVIVTETKPVDEMNRVELRAAALDAFATQMDSMSDDELRAGVKRHQDGAGEDDGGAGDGSTGGTPYADLKDRPLGNMKTADLDTIAREEGVDFAGATNNPDRVKAIEAARKAKTQG